MFLVEGPVRPKVRGKSPGWGRSRDEGLFAHRVGERFEQCGRVVLDGHDEMDLFLLDREAGVVALGMQDIHGDGPPFEREGTVVGFILFQRAGYSCLQAGDECACLKQT